MEQEKYSCFQFSFTEKTGIHSVGTCHLRGCRGVSMCEQHCLDHSFSDDQHIIKTVLSGQYYMTQVRETLVTFSRRPPLEDCCQHLMNCLFHLLFPFSLAWWVMSKEKAEGRLYFWWSFLVCATQLDELLSFIANC